MWMMNQKYADFVMVPPLETFQGAIPHRPVMQYSFTIVQVNQAIPQKFRKTCQMKIYIFLQNKLNCPF